MANSYEILGVRPDAGPDEIRAAYIALMKHHHPDAAGLGGAAADRARAINHAFWILRDPARRTRHDHELRQQAVLAAASAGDIHRSRALVVIHAHVRRRARMPLFGMLLLLTVTGIAVALLVLTIPGPLERRPSSAIAPPGDAPAQLEEAAAAPPVEWWNVHGAVGDLRRVIGESGAAGAEAYSRRCFSELGADPAYNLLDHCIAFDLAAALLGRSRDAPAPAYFADASRRQRHLEALTRVGGAEPAEARLRAIERETIAAAAPQVELFR